MTLSVLLDSHLSLSLNGDMSGPINGEVKRYNEVKEIIFNYIFQEFSRRKEKRKELDTARNEVRKIIKITQESEDKEVNKRLDVDSKKDLTDFKIEEMHLGKKIERMTRKIEKVENKLTKEANETWRRELHQERPSLECDEEANSDTFKKWREKWLQAEEKLEKEIKKLTRDNTEQREKLETRMMIVKHEQTVKSWPHERRKLEKQIKELLHDIQIIKKKKEKHLNEKWSKSNNEAKNSISNGEKLKKKIEKATHQKREEKKLFEEKLSKTEKEIDEKQCEIKRLRILAVRSKKINKEIQTLKTKEEELDKEIKNLKNGIKKFDKKDITILAEENSLEDGKICITLDCFVEVVLHPKFLQALKNNFKDTQKKIEEYLRGSSITFEAVYSKTVDKSRILFVPFI